VAPTDPDDDVALLVAALEAAHRDAEALPLIRGLLATRLVDGGVAPIRLAARLGVRRVAVRSWLAAWARAGDDARRAADAFPLELTAGYELEQLRGLRGRTTRLAAERDSLACAAVDAGAGAARLAAELGVSEAQLGRWIRRGRLAEA